MLVDQRAGRLAHSDKVLMCGTIKGLTTDWILEAYSHMLLVFFLARKCSRAVFSCVDINVFLLTLHCDGVKRPMYGEGGIFSRLTCWKKKKKHALTRIGFVHAHIHALTLTLAKTMGPGARKI